METSEVAKKIGVTAGTLRVWERRRLIGPIKKDARGWRTWSEKDLAACLALLNKLHGRAR